MSRVSERLRIENRIVELILENDLKGSYDFLQRLRKIRDKSKVANILSQLFADEFYIASDLQQNWIDVTSEPEMVSFLSDQRAKRTPMQWDQDESGYYEAPGRGTIRIGRFAQTLLSDKNVIEDLEELNLGLEDLKSSDYEVFVNLYKSEHKDVSKRFELVKGEDIRKYYDYTNHAIPDKGQLGSSCMRYTKCQKYFGIYVHNPEVCSLLVYLDQDDKVLGRALVWKLHKKVKGCPAEYFMDRIYTAYDSDMIKFKNYAKENGWVTKEINSSSDLHSIIFNYNGEVFISHISVQLEKSGFTKYPFLDTLTFLSRNGRLHNIPSQNGRDLTSTNGDYYGIEDSDSRRREFEYRLEELIHESELQKYRELAERVRDELSS